MSSRFVQELFARYVVAHPTSSWRGRAAPLLDRVIFSSLLALLTLTAIPYGTVEPLWVAAFECVVFGLAALWAVEGFLSGMWFVKEHRVLVPLLLLMGFICWQTILVPWNAPGAAAAGAHGWQATSADPFETRLVALKLLALTLVVALLFRYTSTTKRLRALTLVIIGLSVSSALFGILRQTTQHNKVGFILPYLVAEAGYAQFINKNHFAYLMEMALGLALGVIVARGAPGARALVYLACALPLGTALILANSRGGIFALLGQLTFLAIFWAAQRPGRTDSPAVIGASGWWQRISRSVAGRVVLVACLLLFMVGGMLWVGGDQLATRLVSVGDEVSAGNDVDQSGGGRKDIWKATWRLIQAHPLAGVGFGGYWVAIPAYHVASGVIVPQQAHNDYLELLASGGLIGTALALWFVVLVLRRTRASLRSTESYRRAVASGALAGLCGVAIHSLFDFGLHITVNALVFGSLVVIATLAQRAAGPRA